MSRNFTMPMILNIALAVFIAPIAEAYKAYPRDRYDVILEKAPFGELPPGFVEPGSAGENGAGDAKVEIIAPEEVLVAQEELSGKIRMQCVNIAPCGDVMVGFLDESDNSARYYLAIGDSHRGFSILDADYDREWAQIVKDGIMVTMKLGEGKIDPPEGSAGVNFVFTNVVASTEGGSFQNKFKTAEASAKAVSAKFSAQNLSESEKPAASSSFVERLRKRELEKRKREEKGAEEQKRKLLELVRATTKEEIEKQKLEEEQAEDAHVEE